MIKVGVVGGTGYTGVELLRLVAAHPEATLDVVTSRTEAGKAVAELFPHLRGHVDLSFMPPDSAALAGCDLVFFATPNGTAMGMVPQLLDQGVRVIDLAADFRLKDPQQWQQWYGMEHACPALLDEAVYGLPEVNRAQIRPARLVANPGCYPTAIQLGFLPLIEQGLIEVRSLIADAKSGVSGAGRQARVELLFCEADQSVKAYGVAGHRHHPEICQGLSLASGEAVALTFVPHLMPMIRGLQATLYAELKDVSVGLQALYEQRYGTEPFVDVLPADTVPETRNVRGSNNCQISVHRSPPSNTVVILSVIDNLIKGAAGQAVQNMNIMFGLEETLGLHVAGPWP